MSRKATSWSYGPEVLGLKLTARDLAFLRAVCWSIHPKLRRTRLLTSSGRGPSRGPPRPTRRESVNGKDGTWGGIMAGQHAVSRVF